MPAIGSQRFTPPSSVLKEAVPFARGRSRVGSRRAVPLALLAWALLGATGNLAAAGPPPRPTPTPKPRISRLYDESRSVLGCMQPGQRFVARGVNFRNEPGTWRLAFGGHGIGAYVEATSWSDRVIEATFPHAPQIEPGKVYYVAIREQDGAWVSDLTAAFVACP